MSPEGQELYDRFVSFAADKWGESQLSMAIEELSELICAISHYRRGKITKEGLTSEIADVENMLGQIKHIYGIDPTDVDRIRIEKVRRCCDRYGVSL